MSAARSGPAAQAYDRAQAALAAGDLEAAQRLLEYAQRLAPSDGAITLSIGSVRLQRRDPMASEPFELIARRDDSREAWLGLAATRRLIGQSDAAVQALAEALARHAPTQQAGTLDFHDAVARDAGADGWCGLAGAGDLTGEGELLVSLAERPANMTPLAVRLDGRPVPVVSRDGGTPRAGQRLRLKLPDGWRMARQLTGGHGAATRWSAARSTSPPSSVWKASSPPAMEGWRAGPGCRAIPMCRRG